MNTQNTTKQQQTSDSRYQNRNKYLPTRQSYPGSNLTYVRNAAIEKSTCSHILVGCNTQGQMSFGLAGTMARTYPEILPSYKAAIQHGNFTVGSARVARTRTPDTTLILMGIWRLQEFAANLDWIESALRRMCNAMMDGKIAPTSIATAKLGCGGPTGLDWAEVGKTMAIWLSSIQIPVEIYIGHDDPAYFLIINEAGEPINITLKAGEVLQSDLEHDDL